MRVLVAEDDVVSRRILETLLRNWGHDVVTTLDGEQAWRAMCEPGSPALAILDMSMPHLQGLDVIRYMRTEKRLMRIPIMLITAEQNVKLLADGFSAGAAAFLPKPFTPDQLRSVLRMLLGTKTRDSRAA